MATTKAKKRGGRPRTLEPKTDVQRRLLAWIDKLGGFAALVRATGITEVTARGLVYLPGDPSVETLRKLRAAGLPEHLLVDLVG